MCLDRKAKKKIEACSRESKMTFQTRVVTLLTNHPVLTLRTSASNVVSVTSSTAETLTCREDLKGDRPAAFEPNGGTQREMDFEELPRRDDAGSALWYEMRWAIEDG